MTNGSQYVAGAAFAVLLVLVLYAVSHFGVAMLGVALVLWLAHRGRRHVRRTIRRDDRRGA